VCGPYVYKNPFAFYFLLNKAAGRKNSVVYSIEDNIGQKINSTEQIELRPDIGMDQISAFNIALRKGADTVFINSFPSQDLVQKAFEAADKTRVVLNLNTFDLEKTFLLLKDYGLENQFSQVILSISQYLTSQLCPDCRRRVNDLSRHIPSSQTEFLSPDQWLYQADPRGCEKCFFQGSRNLIPVCSVLDSEDMEKIETQAFKSEKNNFWQDFTIKALNGLVSCENLSFSI
jgi:type II secretory ATPase GspE/PulE/Tfp pilus assembly ATPase PilB-like protein